MRAALYSRVSTEDQDCSMQVEALREYAEARSWEVVAEYRESISSVKKRPLYDELLQRAAAREFDVVLVWKLDRFGRSVLDCSESLQALDAAGVRFITTTQGLDTDQTNPVARFLLHILLACAEFERSLISERTRAGLARARKAGKHIGRPRRIFDREKARRLHREGMSGRKIAKALGVGEGTVRRALASR